MTEPYSAPQPPAPATAHAKSSKKRPVGLMVAAAGAAVAIALGAVGATLALTRTPDAKPAAVSVAPPPATSAPASHPPAAREPLALGQLLTFNNGGMTTAVLQYKQPVGDGPGPTKGEVMGGVEVQTCVLTNADTQQVSVAPWSLSWADGATTSQRWSGVVSAAYPYEPKTLTPGKCVKGWIVFSVPEARKPALAVYEGDANRGRPVEWKLG